MTSDNRPNVILLTVDALRADHLSFMGYERETSPFLDQFASENVAFTTAISASSHTREALPALLSGHYPDVFAANGYRCVTPTIADRLSEAGYRTAGFHSNPYVSRAYGYDSGFDTLDDDLLLGQHRIVALAQRALNKFLFSKGEYHVRAAELNDRALAWLDSLDDEEPFFLWNHYMDVHGPYNPPPEYATHGLTNNQAHDLYQKSIKRPAEITQEEQRILVDCYDEEIRYLDDRLSSFFDSLAERGLLTNSLVIITADHGDAFGEHGYYTHPRFLHESLLRVPLVLSSPGEAMEETVQTPVSTLDIVPTILEVPNLSCEELPGTPLVNSTEFPERDDSVVFSIATGEDEHEGVRRFAARGEWWKAMVEREIDSGTILDERVYDLREEPVEQEPAKSVTRVAEDIVEQLREFSSTRLNSINQSSKGDVIPEKSAEIGGRLEALGYK